jgi:signal transduction histidine kinase
MAEKWTDPIRVYASDVAGAALRHDFGIPLGLIGRNAGFICELIEDGRLNDLPDRERALITGGCESIANLSIKIHDAMRTLGKGIKNATPLLIKQSYEKIDQELAPLLAELHRNALSLARLTARVRDTEAARYSRDLYNNTRRVQVMYSGLNYFFKFDYLDAELFAPVQFNEMCSRLAKAVRISGDVRALKNIPVDGVAEAECIENQITLVIQNLLQNAVKFTRHLEMPIVAIFLRMTSFSQLKQQYPDVLRDYEARGLWLELHVLDNGPGIGRDDLPHIFNLYYRSPKGRKLPGTGMGLAIAKLVTTIHGGFIFVNPSTHATDFVLLLPHKHSEGIPLRRLVTQELAL